MLRPFNKNVVRSNKKIVAVLLPQKYAFIIFWGGIFH